MRLYVHRDGLTYYNELLFFIAYPELKAKPFMNHFSLDYLGLNFVRLSYGNAC